jgi:hypothetical protein
MTNQIEANSCCRQSDDNLPDITAEYIDHVRTILGANNHGGRSGASKQLVSARPRKERVVTPEPRRKKFAHKLAASSFRTARWGQP